MAQSDVTAAGAFGKERFRARRRAWRRRVWWVLPAIGVLPAAMCAGLAALFARDQLSLYLAFGLGAGLATALVLADSPPNHIERWRQGYEGEKATARELRGLVGEGWLLVNDIDIGRGNIDHVVVGPAGVFLLETKSLHGSLTVRRGILSVRWREDPDDGYENRGLTARMQRLRGELERRLEDHGLVSIPIQPVVVLWGHFEQGAIRSKGYIAWVHGKQLDAVLRRQPERLSAHEVARIGATLRSRR